MTSEFDVTELQQSRATRRTVVATGVKLAYAAPVLAASFKLSAINAFAAVSGGFCGHSTGPNGGCMGACTSAVEGAGCTMAGKKCGVICGTGQSVGACSAGQGENNPYCNPGYCDPANYAISNTCAVSYIGPPPGGCTAV